jgi:predicted transcriptional regulator
MIRVPPEVEAAVLERVRSGVYHTADQVLTLAIQMLTWAENDPAAKRQLLKFALAAGIADADAGRTISGEEVIEEMRARARG